jgi:hypothetical protein
MRLAVDGLIAGRRMRKKLLATLIVCVALLTQIGASLSGAAAARDGIAGGLWCHKQIAAAYAAKAGAATPPGDTSAPNGAPASHDHASCSFCQAGVDAPTMDAAWPAPRIVAFSRRLALLAPAPVFAPVFNRSAPARAPPSHV